MQHNSAAAQQQYQMQLMQMQQMQAQQAAAYSGAAGGTGRSLYIGNLDPRVTEQVLFDLFSMIGQIEVCKVIKDKYSGQSLGYGFVDYTTHQAAAQALDSMNGRALFGMELRVGWAHAATRSDEGGANHIFIGDLSTEIDDKALFDAFSPFGPIIESRVMWDPQTGRSRGYGFIAYKNREDAERAIRDMNGEFLGSRTIRVNWANQRTGSAAGVTGGGARPGTDLNTVLAAASPGNVTVYVGNLDAGVPEEMLRAAFEPYGAIEELRVQKDKGFCFVKYASHDQAARAIVGVTGKVIGTKAVKCAWGKEKDAMPAYPVYAGGAYSYGYGGGGGAPYYQAPAAGYAYGYNAPQNYPQQGYWSGGSGYPQH